MLGLESLLFSAGSTFARELGSLSATVELVSEITDEMLPETECPGRAVAVLDVSLDTRERGLGMNSRVSEKPTLFRAIGLGVSWASSDGAA